ncbi:hypothetical protein [Streptomyces sp. NPDC008001]|uniref:hypothetical protein n=1 Tax=Streptomyces sp. NPDC008001 TaxID=3364804 RepID=UPI0036EDA139
MQRTGNGAAIVWDGNNHIGRLDVDTQDATDAIEALVKASDLGEMWTADESGITAQTTGGELVQVQERLLAELRKGQE